MAKSFKYFSLTGLSGLLLALAYPGWGFDLGFLGWLGFVPLFFALYFIGLENNGKKYGKFFLSAGFGGLVYFLIIFRWFWSFYPLDTLGIQSGPVSFAILLPIYLATCAAMAAFWGLFGLGLGYFFNKAPRQATATSWLIGPSVFIFLEYARSAGYGLLWFGPGTLFGAHWTMGNFAYMLADNPAILKLSSYIGIYGVAFLIIAANLLFFKFLRAGRKKSAAIIFIAASVSLITVVPEFFYKNNGGSAGDNAKRINFAVVQTNIPTIISPSSKQTLDGFKEQLNLLNSVAKNHPESQMIAFPEASDFFKNLSNILNGAQAEAYFTNLFKEPRLIISGIRALDGGKAYSRVFSLNTKKDIIGYHDKQLLTPGGEFLPYSVRLAANIFFKTKVSQFDDLRDFRIGRNRASTLNFEGKFNVAPIICSELISPALTRSITKGSDVIVGMASYGIFHGKDTFQKQNLAVVRFRAAENQKPILMAVNMGRSYVINGSGGLQVIASDKSPQILTGNVVLEPQKSWYNKVGNMPIFLVSLALIIFFIFLTRPKKSKEV